MIARPAAGTPQMTPVAGSDAVKPGQDVFNPGPVGFNPMWRAVAGAVLQDERHRQRRTLAQVASRAGMSVQYLSELQRGRKEASSEMLAAACGSLGLTLAEFAIRCAGMLGSAGQRPNGPTLLAA